MKENAKLAIIGGLVIVTIFSLGLAFCNHMRVNKLNKQLIQFNALLNNKNLIPNHYLNQDQNKSNFLDELYSAMKDQDPLLLATFLSDIQDDKIIPLIGRVFKNSSKTTNQCPFSSVASFMPKAYLGKIMISKDLMKMLNKFLPSLGLELPEFEKINEDFFFSLSNTEILVEILEQVNNYLIVKNEGCKIYTIKLK